jgi:selenocysteine lyase/cysteine desulfurase
MDKRDFLKKISLLSMSVLPGTAALSHLIDEMDEATLDQLTTDEDFWLKIRAGFRLNPAYTNLENGYYCILPEETLEHYLAHVREVNFLGSYYMRKLMADNHTIVRLKLANLAGCSTDELIITRNTTESLDTIISGYPWKKGDEAIMSHQDYGAMLDMFRSVKERYQIDTKFISLPNHPKSDEEIVDLYRQQVTKKTKLILVCHLININGHVLPIRKICDMAHSLGVEVMVDGAHAFAQLDFKIPDLNCDYYGASLHKWLGAPLGCGLLYVRKEKISKIWPLLAAEVLPLDSIDRLNHTGTKPVHVDLCISNAIDYHLAIGANRKENRLKFLKKYWVDQIKDNKKIQINTPFEEERSSAIANVLVIGMTPQEMATRLLEEFKIWTVAINNEAVKGCRITPSIYTTTAELDLLVGALRKMCGD